MAQLEGSGGGSVGKLWRKHGGGYYAVLAVGSFIYMEINSLIESFSGSSDIMEFVKSEVVGAILTFGLETILNTFLAGIWPFMWASWMGTTSALAWAGGGYVVWTVILAWLLARREKEYRKELGL